MKTIDTILALEKAKDKLWESRQSIERKCKKMRPKRWHVALRQKRKTKKAARKGNRRKK